MASTTIPGTELQGYWDEGESGWKPGMDENLARLSALTQLSVPSLTAALVPANGVQVAPAGHPNAFHVAAHIKGQWWFYAPTTGIRAYVRDVAAWFLFDGSTWVRESTAAHVISPVVTASRTITEAEFAVGATIEVNSTADVVLTVPAPGSAPLQLGASVARRPVNVIRTGPGGVSVTAAAGSTLISAGNAFSTFETGSGFTIIPLTGDRYAIIGDLM